VSGRRWLALDAGASNWLWLSLAIVAVDQATKYLIAQSFAEYEELELLPVLDLIRLHNTGAAFSFLSNAGGWQRWFFLALGVVISIGILIWLRRLPAKGQHLLAAGLACVLGGALGNVIDRARFGYVVDFIHVHWHDAYFPAFNAADSAITIGAGLLILENIISVGRDADAKAARARAERASAKDRAGSKGGAAADSGAASKDLDASRSGGVNADESPPGA